MLTTKEQVTERLTQALDVQQLNSTFRKLKYAFGEPWETSGVDQSPANEWPVYPDIRVREIEVGRSRRILNTAYQVAARLLSNTPMPSFPKVSRETNEVRRAWWKAMYQGDEYARYDWRTQIEQAVIEGDCTGFGCVQVGMWEHPSGYQNTVIRHVPALQVMYDRFARGPLDARWVAAAHFLAEEDAIAQYGKAAIDGKVREYAVSDTSLMSQRAPMVRVIEYYDLGYGRGQNSHAIVIGDVSDEPLYVKENPFDCLPFAFYSHFLAPGMRYPIGRVDMQMATAEAINTVERHLHDGMGEPNVWVVDTTKVDVEELQEYFDLAPGVHLVPSTVPMDTPIVKVDKSMVDQHGMVLLQHHERQYASDSGLTDLDRGVQLPDQRTKAEAQMVQAGSLQTGSKSRHGSMVFLSDLVRKVFKVASMYDRTPITVDVFGHPFELNVPDDPATGLDRWLEGPSTVMIDEDSLTVIDDRARQNERLGRLQAALTMLQPFQTMDPTWIHTEVLKAIGEVNPEEALAQAPMQMQGGMPMEGAEGVA